MSSAPKKIILDRNRSSLLLDATESELGRKPAVHGVEDALLSLLLFDEAEITVDNSDERMAGIERLRSEGIATPVPKDCFREPSRLLDSYFRNASSDFNTEERFTALAQERSFESIWGLIAANDDDLREVEYERNMSDLRMWANEIGGGSSVYEINFDDYSNGLSKERNFGLPSRSEYQGHPQFMGELEEHLINMGLDGEVKDLANEIRRANDTVPIFLSRYVEMRGIIDRATNTGHPICANFEDGDYKPDLSLGESALQLCRIHLDEVRSVPYMRSIDDVLRLRGNPHISNFRESIFEWLDRISAGETDVEGKYREKIRLANKEIEKLDRWRHLNSPYTIGAGLAVGVADVIFGSFLGFGFGIASAAAVVHKQRVKKNYGYALFRP